MTLFLLAIELCLTFLVILVALYNFFYNKQAQKIQRELDMTLPSKATRLLSITVFVSAILAFFTFIAALASLRPLAFLFSS